MLSLKPGNVKKCQIKPFINQFYIKICLTYVDMDGMFYSFKQIIPQNIVGFHVCVHSKVANITRKTTAEYLNTNSVVKGKDGNI